MNSELYYMPEHDIMNYHLIDCSPIKTQNIQISV